MGKLKSTDDMATLRGDELIAEYRRRFGDTTLLAFSRGKDSIACALALRGKLDVIPVHYDIVPGLPFVEESLQYYEKKLFDRRILRFTHPSFYRQLSNLMYQTPGNAEVLASSPLPSIDYKDVHDMVCEQEGIEDDILSAAGVRAADSPLRRMSVTNHGAIRVKTKVWWPIWDWNKARLIEEIERSKISLPIDYLLWGRSLDGLDARFIIPMKEHLPNDWKRVLEYFPLAEVEIKRYELHQRGWINEAASAQKTDKAR